MGHFWTCPICGLAQSFGDDEAPECRNDHEEDE